MHIRLDRQCLFAKQASGPRWSCGSIQTFSFSGGEKKRGGAGAGVGGERQGRRARDSTSCADAWALQAGKAGEVGGGGARRGGVTLQRGLVGVGLAPSYA